MENITVSSVIPCFGKYDLLAKSCEGLKKNLPARGNNGKCWTRSFTFVR